MKRAQLNKYRSGTEPRTDVAARLVRAASGMLGRPVKVSELFDVGEDVPVGARADDAPAFPRNDLRRKHYASRIDAFIRLLDIPPNAFAQKIGMSRRQLARLRSGESLAFVGTVRRMVAMLREKGYEVIGSDIADFGEEEAAR